MKIESPVLGTVEVAEDKLIEFPAGLSGFEHLRRFALLHDEESNAQGLYYLLPVEAPELLFSVTDPANIAVNYEIRLSDEESASIGLADPAKTATLVILRRREEGEEAEPESAGLLANIMAPLVVDLEARKGLQKVLSRVDCQVTLRSL